MGGDVTREQLESSSAPAKVRSHRQLEALARHANAVAALSQRALASPEPQELFDLCVQLSAGALEAQSCALTEAVAERRELRLLAGFGLEAAAPGTCFSQLSLPIPTRAIETVAPVRIDDWRSDQPPEWASAPLPAGEIRSSAAVPLVRGGQAVAALAAHRRELAAFDDHEVGFLQSMANVVAGFVDRRALFTRLQLTDRLAAVATLASGVAHEMNNPLTYVLANMMFLEEELQLVAVPGHVLREGELRRALEALREAREGAQRLAAIVRDLRTFSSGDSETPTLVSLVPVVLSSVNVTQSQLRNRARLELDVAPVPMVRGNAARLGQVCLNLLVNAAQAIAPGEPERHRVSVRTRLAGGEILLEIADTGGGIAPAHLRRIFDPFFTTKGPGIGSGLGLAICHGIVESMGGRIEVESQLGRGATFRVLLPNPA